MEYKDYYQTLGIPRNSDQNEIKRAFRRLARQYHPDKNPGNKLAEDKFKEINEAYEVLGSADNRARYDQLGENYHRFRQKGGDPRGYDFSDWFGAGSGSRNPQMGADDLFGNAASFSDFFNAVFGGRRGATGSPSGQGNPSSAGRDVKQTVEISLEEAYHGTTRVLTYENGERITARIPAGATNGARIRLRGQAGGGVGDLYLVVRLAPHPTFKPDGRDLRVAVEVDVVTAVLGGKVPVPTLIGPVTLTIPPGTQGGRTFRLKGRGMPHLREKEQFGDLLAQVQIRVPEKLGSAEQQLYERLAELARSKDVFE